MCPVSDARFFNDEPVDGSPNAPDLLGRQQYAKHASTLLHRVREQSESGVLALIGPWGSGKSSVLQMVMQQLRQAELAEPTGQARRFRWRPRRRPAAEDTPHTQWSVAELNPWMYSDVESLALALFSEIRGALPKGAHGSEVRRKLGEFAQSISPLGKLTSLIGLDSSDLIKHVGDRISGDTSASAAKHAAEAALRRADRPVLVVMDDLDRLTPEELLVVFKLVRLVGHLPNIYYMISFDEQTLLDVLQRSDLVGDSDHRAREFLEKIIQVRLDLPAFRDRDTAAMGIRSLNALLDAHGLAMTPGEERRFSEAYFRHLQDRLQTPRAIKRYFGQADATLGSLAGNVDLVDFLIVTFLRTNEPGVYRLLGRHRAELTGTSIATAVRRSTQPGERAEHWQTRLRTAGVAEGNIDGVLNLLALLFPTVQQDLGNGGDTKAAAQRRGIGSADYFDRYMVFGVPGDDLSEAAFDQALAQLNAGVPEEEAAELLLRLCEDTHRITRRIQHRRRRTIPADTGTTSSQTGQPDHPRRRGSDAEASSSTARIAGPSPQARGRHRPRRVHRPGARDISAGVGATSFPARQRTWRSDRPCGPWSSGVVEGHVNRIKMLKRRMFGRAGFHLLRKRALFAPLLARQRADQAGVSLGLCGPARCQARTPSRSLCCSRSVGHGG
ncbi:P-loop NTPase fold protein [Streptomyces sp. NPDC056512]|uniref:KAP family P-loop NTPase fold protein n=1 Tax=Streptomyces sp. NPDC056512 TaxID=3345846 RepID=UPI0036AC41BB